MSAEIVISVCTLGPDPLLQDGDPLIVLTYAAIQRRWCSIFLRKAGRLDVYDQIVKDGQDDVVARLWEAVGYYCQWVDNMNPMYEHGAHASGTYYSRLILPIKELGPGDEAELVACEIEVVEGKKYKLRRKQKANWRGFELGVSEDEIMDRTKRIDIRHMAPLKKSDLVKNKPQLSTAEKKAIRDRIDAAKNRDN